MKMEGKKEMERIATGHGNKMPASLRPSMSLAHLIKVAAILFFLAGLIPSVFAADQSLYYMAAAVSELAWIHFISWVIVRYRSRADIDIHCRKTGICRYAV